MKEWKNKWDAPKEQRKLWKELIGKETGFGGEIPNFPDRMFINTTTTGGHAWAPSSGVLPSDIPEASKVDDFLQESSGDLDDLIAIE
ncbi:unnamed protein product [Prunus armeniaca]